VTVCVESTSSSAGSTSQTTTTKTVVVNEPVAKKAKKKAPAKAKSAPVAAKITAPTTVQKPVQQPISCPTPNQLASMPKSADAAERWVQSVCNPYPVASKPKVTVPAPIKTAKAPVAPKTKTVTETTVVKSPGSSYSTGQAVNFSPAELTAQYFPNSVLAIGQSARFVSNPLLHYLTQPVLGRQAEVQFTPVSVVWEFSDGLSALGSETTRSFLEPGKYFAMASVSYSISYRLLGETSWQEVQGQIVVSSNTLEVPVGLAFLTGDRANALLVGQDCGKGPIVFGCEP
jgi:hypothetical protein